MTYVSKKFACGILAIRPPSYDLYQILRQETGIVRQLLTSIYILVIESSSAAALVTPDKGPPLDQAPSLESRIKAGFTPQKCTATK